MEAYKAPSIDGLRYLGLQYAAQGIFSSLDNWKLCTRERCNTRQGSNLYVMLNLS